MLLGLLLTIAGSLKAYQLATEPTAASHLLASRPFLIGLVEFEWLLAAWLLAGVFRRAAWWTALGTFFVFGVLSLVQVVRGESGCGCFGALQISPWLALTIDMAAITSLALCRPAMVSNATASGLRFLVVSIALVLISAPATWAMARFEASIVASDGVIVGAGRTVVLEPSEWPGKPFPLLTHVDRGEMLAKGQWEVWLHRDDCQKCVDKLRRYKEPASPPIVLLTVSPHVERRDEGLWTQSGLQRARLSAKHEWFVETPVTLYLSDGIVVDVEEGT